MSNCTDVAEWAEAGRALAAGDSKNKWDIAEWLLTAERCGFDSKYRLAANILNFAIGTCCEYARVARAFPPARRIDKLCFGHHQAVAALPETEQARLLGLAAEKKLSVSKLRTAVRKLNRSADNARDAILYPPGVFRILYADPPWHYRPDDATFRRGEGATADHYSTMPLDEICNMQLPRLADDAVLFLWAVVPLLPDAFRVLDAWGFTYKAQFIWDKIKPNKAQYNGVNHEILLIATRGSCTPDSDKRFDSVVSIERTEHSRKPPYFRELIDTMYPSGQRIELFARGKLPAGWAGWGNEFEPTPPVQEEEGPFATAARVEAYNQDTA